MATTLEIGRLLDRVAPGAGGLPAAPAGTAEPLRVQFEALMQRRSAPPSYTNDETSRTVSKLVMLQDAELQKVVADMMAFAEAAPGMSLNDLQAAGMTMSLELAGMHLDMQAKMAVVDSSKSAIETLMRQE